eukprot:scaffold265757_cov31-Tisochrysis_lutea.AAC.2
MVECALPLEGARFITRPEYAYLIGCARIVSDETIPRFEPPPCSPQKSSLCWLSLVAVTAVPSARTTCGSEVIEQAGWQ